MAIHDGSKVLHCRAVELSATGILIELGRYAAFGAGDALLRLELFVPKRDRPVRALARVVRSLRTRRALTFVAINDADRLTLMEHLDNEHASSNEAIFAGN